MDFNLEKLKQSSWFKVIDENEGIINKVEIRTPDGLIVLNRLKVNSKIFDELIKAAIMDKKELMFQHLESQIMFLIDDDTIKEKLMIKKDSVTKLRLLISSGALLMQAGDIDF